LNIVGVFETLTDRTLGKEFLEYLDKQVGKFDLKLSMEKCMYYGIDVTGFNSKCYING